MISLGIELARAQLKISQEGSYLGILWHVISPIITIFVLLTVFLLIFPLILSQSIDYYPLYLLVGILVFEFFRGVTVASTKIFYSNRHLIKSIKFPYESLIVSALLTAMLSHIIQIIIFAFILFYFGIPLLNILLYIPVLLILTLFIYGLSLLLSSLSVFFIDLSNIYSAFTHILWFATPIFYMLYPGNILFTLNHLNPVYYFIEASRDVLIYGAIPDSNIIFGMIGYSFAILIIGLVIFKRSCSKFSEFF